MNGRAGNRVCRRIGIAAVAALISACLLRRVTPLSAQAIVVEPAVRISPLGSGNHTFTNIATDPEDARHLIACGIRASPTANTWQGFVYGSSDSGKSWVTAMVDSSGQLVSEEACAFGPDGHAYFNAETWNPRYERRRLGRGILRFYRSLDAGRTWTPVIVDPTRYAWMDYARIGVDLTAGPNHGRVYVFSNDGPFGAEGDAVFPMRYSFDAGLHFSDRVRLPLLRTPKTGFPHVVVVLPDGTVLAAYVNAYADSSLVGTTTSVPARETQLIQIVRSSDGGRTLQPPITVAAGTGFPSMAADLSTGLHHGRLYLVWPDTVGDRSHVFLATSDDEGKTWSKPRVVDDLTASGKSASGKSSPVTGPFVAPLGARDASVAVNREGVVGLVWAENGSCWHFAASRNGGETFLPSVLLNACAPPPLPGFQPAEQMSTAAVVDPTDRIATADFTRKGFTVRVSLGGGAAGLAADAAGAFHPLWSVTGTDGRLWTTRVIVRTKDMSPPAAPASVVGLADVSSRVALEFSNQDYDVVAGLLSLDLTLVNVDSLPIAGPVRIQVTRMSSGLAPAVEVMNADNGTRGAGAVWDLSAVLRANGIAAYGKTAPRRLTFRFPRGIAGGPLALGSQMLEAPLVSAEVKVFAGH